MRNYFCGAIPRRKRRTNMRVSFFRRGGRDVRSSRFANPNRPVHSRSLLRYFDPSNENCESSGIDTGILGS